MKSPRAVEDFSFFLVILQGPGSDSVLLALSVLWRFPPGEGPGQEGLSVSLSSLALSLGPAEA
jgi:hypothetical protein